MYNASEKIPRTESISFGTGDLLCVFVCTFLPYTSFGMVMACTGHTFMQVWQPLHLS